MYGLEKMLPLAMRMPGVLRGNPPCQVLHDLFWSAFRWTESVAFIELLGAARHDRELAAMLEPVRLRHERCALDEFAATLGRGHANADAVGRATVMLMQGLFAFGNPLSNAQLGEMERARLDEWKALARQLLA